MGYVIEGGMVRIVAWRGDRGMVGSGGYSTRCGVVVCLGSGLAGWMLG